MSDLETNRELTVRRMSSIENDVLTTRLKVDTLIAKVDELIELMQAREVEAATDCVIVEPECEPEFEQETNTEEYYFAGKNISKTFQKYYRYTEVDPQIYDFKFRSKRNKIVHSSFTVFDVIILMGLENEPTHNSWLDLAAMIGINDNVLKRLTFNIAAGFFDDLITDIPISFSKENGLLYVNGKKTKVPVKTAKYIVTCITNSPNPMTTLLKLEKSGECSKLMTRIIGTNYKNSELTSLFTKNQVWVENNPEKRKESI